MQRNEIWPAIELELRNAKKQQPNWPEHIVAEAAIVANEAGNLLHASLEYKYERATDDRLIAVQKKQLEKQAIQTAAMAIRFLENI